MAGETEVEEGFLNCTSCKSVYPIICSVPFMLDDMPSYFSIRMSLGGQLMLLATSSKMKSFVKETLRKIKHTSEDTSDLERKWVGIYRNSLRSKFYSRVRDLMQKLPASSLVLEHGCSIGNMVRESAKRNSVVFGMDKSFYGIVEAKKNQRKNSDFLLADSLNTPFGSQKFDLVMALNLLDIVEPSKLLKIISRQTKKFLMLSDPYDFDRGKNSVKTKTGPEELRSYLRNAGFAIVQGTGKPSYIPWKLNVNSRLYLDYKVDVIVARKN